MKKFLSIFVVLMIVCLVPFAFMGCEGNKTASQVADAYSKLQEKQSDFFDSNSREFKVEFTASNIRSSMNVSGSKIFSLGKVYLPMLNTTMAFVNSKAKVFKDCLSKFSQSEINEVYAGLKDFESALKDFASAKLSFENINQSSGTGYPAFLVSMQKLINASQRFALAFYNGYYKNVYVKQRDYTAAGFTFNNDDMKVETMGSKLYVAYILNNHYIKHYVWSNDNNINQFLSKDVTGEYLGSCIDILSNSNVSAYSSSDEATLKVLRQNHNTFLKDLKRAIRYMKNVPYKDIYQGLQEVDDLDDKQRDSYNYVENFMESKYLPVYNAAILLSA